RKLPLFLVFLINTTLFSAQSTEQVPSILDQLYTKAYATFQWLTAPLYSGYTYSETEKEFAREAIKALLEKQKELKNMLKIVDLPRNQKIEIRKELALLDKELYGQQIITGEKWSKRRQTVVFGLSVAGAAAIGAFSYPIYKKWQEEQLLKTAWDKKQNNNDLENLKKEIKKTEEEADKIDLIFSADPNADPTLK